MAARLLTLAALLCWAAPALAERPIPPLTGPVVDEAGLLDGGSLRALETLCRRARAAEGGQGVQLQYLVVRSLDGEALESFSMRVAEAWRLGTKGKDNGVLVLVALAERRVRIEVGGGIEGGLTDAQSGRIIRNTIAPAFRERRHGEGLLRAGTEILAALGAMPAGQAVPQTRPSGWRMLGGALPYLLFFLVPVLIFAIRGIDRSPRRRGGWGGPFLGGGGGLGGGSSGGSWGGGGGGFSGGGASGSW